MKEYSFESVDRKAFSAMLWGSLGIFVIVLGVTIALWNYGDPVRMAGIVASIALPVLFSFIRKRKVRKTGTALIGTNRIIFEISDIVRIINFDNIKHYRIVVYNGAQLYMALRNGQKFRLFAHANYCTTESFATMCRNLEQAIITYAETHEGDKVPIRCKSIFEKTGTLGHMNQN